MIDIRIHAILTCLRPDTAEGTNTGDNECRKESIRKKSIRKKSIGKKESGKKVSGKKNKSQFHVQRIDKRLCNVILINL